MYEYYNPPIIDLDTNEYEFMLCRSFFNINNYNQIYRLGIITFEIGMELTGALYEFGDELYALTVDIALSMLSVERALCLWTDADILYWGIVYDEKGLARSRFKMPYFLTRFREKTEVLNTKIIKKISRHLDTDPCTV